ncbi:MAG TPA: nuclease-related domain-containing protein [Trebonia sp.]|nr:nuclease-related domain-containing protein [Trebonia sp.]
MYSETAGVSYENPEPPEAQGTQQGSKQPEAELRRVVSYPEGPKHSDPEAPGDPAGRPDQPEAESTDAGIDGLLDDALDDDPFDVGSLDDDLDTDPLTDTGGPAVPPRIITPDPGRSRPSTPVGVSPSSAPDGGESHRKGAFRIIRGGEGGGPSVSGPPAGQPSRQRALDIVMDARMRYWRERVAIMVAVGLLFGILIGNWVVGLTLAILAGIAHAFWRSGPVASIPPGVKLDRAQRVTQRKLARMERAGYRALHMRPIPGSDDIIDHLVVGPTGVYAIDSERWSSKLPIRTRNGKQLWVGPNSQKARLEHARSEAGRAAELLSARLGREISVRPALAIYGPHIPWDIAVIREVDVFNGERLRKYLRRRSRIREIAKLSRDDVARIHEAAELALPFAPSAHEVTPVG